MTNYSAQELRQFSTGLTETMAKFRIQAEAKSVANSYDVFLSHSVLDANVILGLKRLLEGQALTVYVDWIEDPELDRARVSAATAARLRQRMDTCRSLVYATSRSASRSRWMPWELGYFDGKKSAESIAICPVEPDTASASGFVGEEYLGLYKKLEKVRWSDGMLRSGVITPDRGLVQRATAFASGLGQYSRLTV